MIHVAVVGSRDWPDLARVRSYVAALVLKHPGVAIVSGGARGVDQAAEEHALRLGCRVYSFRPRKRDDGRWEVVLWDRTCEGEDVSPCADGALYPSFARAAHARNRKIAQHAGNVVAFDAGTPGTASAVKAARDLGVPVHVYGASA